MVASNVRISQLEVRAANAEATVEQLEYRIKVLERKSRGTTRANKRASALEREVAALRAAINRIGEVSEVIDPADNKAVAALAREIERVEQGAQHLYTTLDERLSEIASLQQEHGMRLTNHGDRLELLEQGDSGLDLARTRLRLTGSIEKSTPWVPALIAGVIGGIVSWFIQDPWEWVTTFKGDEIAASVIIGVAVFLAVAAFERFSLNLSGLLEWTKREPIKTETVIESVVHDAPAAPKPDDKTEQVPLLVKEEVKA